MTATLRLGASLQTLLGMMEEYDVESGISVRETLINIGIKPELIALVSVNGGMESKEYVIQDKDEVRLLAVIGGG